MSTDLRWTLLFLAVVFFALGLLVEWPGWWNGFFGALDPRRAVRIARAQERRVGLADRRAAR